MVVALALAAAACGDSDDDGSAAANVDGEPASETSEVDLTGVCPEVVSIQTHWNPAAGMGWLFQALGDDYEVDTAAVATRGSLVSSEGVDTGVDLEIRAGGPAVGFQTVTSQIYSDDSILGGFVATDEAIRNSGEFPTVSVFAAVEKNPQMIMWDPETYPDVETIADLGEEGVLVRYFDGAAYMDYLVGAGILSKDQIDGSYDGSPTQFILDKGTTAQQGFGSSEPYFYEFETEEWGRPVAYEYLHEAGWQTYTNTLAVRPDYVEKYADCLAELVPLFQQSSIDYIDDPEPINQLIVDVVEAYDNGYVYTLDAANWSAEQMVTDEIVDNGSDDVIGNFDIDRVTKLIEIAIPIFQSQGADVADDLSVEEVVTNQFIDDSIGL